MAKEPKKRHCRYCRKPLNGRIDKKFCNDWCRNYYNNKKNNESTQIIKTINSKLRRNRSILAELLPKERKSTRVTKIDFLSRGFDFRYITHTLVSKKGFTFSFCYDYGWLALENEEYRVVKLSA
ncbi:MAG: hypothetical protein C5B52_14370 [Bacteroidetes bacterium]|nr:MAG: hypothetical protein C5B52_14370 [Bacteroidota bacterium]